MARRPKLTRDVIDETILLKADDIFNGDIVCVLGIHESMFYRWIGERKNKLQRELSEGLKNEGSAFKRTLLTAIRSAALARNRYWTVIAWLLERKHLDDFGKAEPQRDNAKADAALGLDAWLRAHLADGAHVSADRAAHHLPRCGRSPDARGSEVRAGLRCGGQVRGAGPVRRYRRGDDFWIFCSYNPPRTLWSWVNREKLERERRAWRGECLGEVTGTGGSVFDNIVSARLSDARCRSFSRTRCGVDWGWVHRGVAFPRRG